MSSSKLHKHTDLFKPQEIVKKEPGAVDEWQSLPPRESQPFKTQKVTETPPESTSQQPPEIQPASNPLETADNILQNQSNNQDNPTPPSSGEETIPDIDLSEYIKITEAEKKIKEAYDQGISDSKTKLENDFESASKSLLAICQQLDTIRETILQNSSKELQEFSLAIAEKILRISLKEQDQTIIATIEEALQRAVRSDEFTVYVNPDDFETVKQKSADLIGGLTGLNNIVFKQDHSIERGGAKIESDNCTIDATIASQFDVIREEVKKRT